MSGMGHSSRSIVDIGMDILRAEGAYAEEDEAAEEAQEATEAEVLGALVAQVQTMVDRLAIDGRLATLEQMLVTQAAVLQQLTSLVSLPRRRVPVRDEAGTITEVMDVVVHPEPVGDW